MKSYTSRILRKSIAHYNEESRREWITWMMKRAGSNNGNNKDWQLWQQNNHPLEILNEEMSYQKLNYIHRNPVEEGIVELEEDYLCSSARDFYDKKGLIELTYIK